VTRIAPKRVCQEEAMSEVPSSLSRRIRVVLVSAFGLVLAVLGGMAVAQQDKYSLQVPGGLAFSEFKGYESWQLVSTSQNDKAVAAILANPEMIEAYLAGIPDNGKPFPDGVKMAKIHWAPKQQAQFPDTTVPGAQLDVDFMVKDSKRFADSGGWGWAVFKHDAATNTFTPGTEADEPPQGHDAKCGFECHTVVESRDYVFTEYGKR
jgi:Cytochrome P460